MQTRMPWSTNERALSPSHANCQAVLVIILSRTRYGFMNTLNRHGSGRHLPTAPPISHARFGIGDVVRHRVFEFRGVIFDVDPVFANSEEWYQSIPEDIRPAKDQPFYHLLAENDENAYVAYVSEQNLLPDESGEPVGHPQAPVLFDSFDGAHYTLKPKVSH